MESLIDSLYQIGAIQFGHFQLKSGQTTNIYLNLRKIISYPTILKMVSAAMWEQIAHCDFELICGVPYTALPIATCLSLQHDIPMVIRRREKKDYGTRQMIEGVYEPDQPCLIVEDVITTGSSILETADQLKSVGIIPSQLCVLIDREQGGKETLEKQYPLKSVFKMSSILNYLAQKDFVKAEEKTLIAAFQSSMQTSA
jgi:orotate phosphoribosyltransferase